MAVDNSALLGGFLYAAIPGAALLVGGALVLTMTLNRNLQAAVQNLAAGIILSAVADELVPLMKHGGGDVAPKALGMSVGFAAALALMYSVDRLCGHDDGDAEQSQSLVTADPAAETRVGVEGPAPPPDALRRLSYTRTAKAQPGSWRGLPWALIVGVIVNTCVDGFLIGLTYPASERAALIVSIATSVEHIFLGITYVVTLRGTAQGWGRLAPVVVAPAVAMALAGLVGATCSSLAEDSPAVFAGLMTFGTIALLFLITHELLLEAYDNHDGKQLWWVTIWVFLGFFLVLLIEEFLPEE